MPITLTKIVKYLGKDIERDLLDFSLEFREAESIRKGSIQFNLYEAREPSYLLVVSQTVDPFRKDQKYNVVATVTSEDETRNQQVMKDLASKTSLDLIDTDKEHSEYMARILNPIFPILKRIGSSAFDFLEISD